MPIKSLVRTEGRLPEIGILRKGAEKPERGPGRDLTYFRFTSERPGVVALFQQQYGEQPSALEGVYLMAPTPDQAFDCWQEEWGAGSLKHRCDGEYVVRWQNTKTGKFEDYPNEGKMPCPGGCQRVGRLSVLLPKLGQLATVCLQTSSIHDLIHIPEQLNALYALAQVMPGHNSQSLLGIPICIRRDAKKISVPGQSGKPRSRMAKSLISIEAMPEWFAPKLQQLQAAAMPAVPELATTTVRVDDDVAPRYEQPLDTGHEPDLEEEAEDAEVREIDEATGEIREPAAAVENATDAEREAYTKLLGMAAAKNIELGGFELNLDTTERAEVLRLGHELKLKVEQGR